MKLKNKSLIGEKQKIKSSIRCILSALEATHHSALTKESQMHSSLMPNYQRTSMNLKLGGELIIAVSWQSQNLNLPGLLLPPSHRLQTTSNGSGS